MLRTYLSEAWGLRYPILNAPMTPAATGTLARAVTDAGGLGMIGVDDTWTARDIAEHCAVARSGHARRKFGIGFFGWLLERSPELLDAAIRERPLVISISFIDAAPFAERVRGAGIFLASQVQSRPDIERAIAAGVDVLVAQGTEAGGHTGSVSTLTMLQIALTSTVLPVLVAGGIATPQALAAVLAAGAAGAWVGTPFLLSDEANVRDEMRVELLAATESDTILTSLFDRMKGHPWPRRFPGRALRNAFTDEWDGREDVAANDVLARARFEDASRRGDVSITGVYAGQSVGLLNSRRPAAEIVATLGDGAEQLLRLRVSALLSDR